MKERMVTGYALRRELIRAGRTGVKCFFPLTSDTYLAVNFDLLVCVLVDIADEIVELLHQLEVAEGKFV